VLFAHPNCLIAAQLDHTPNDEYFGHQFPLDNAHQEINDREHHMGTWDADVDAPEAWDITQGSSDVVIAVIDEGVDVTHPDLDANIWENPGEVGGTTGVDDDNNGYVDDVRGWDFVGNDNDPTPNEDNYHGDAAAGVAAAEQDNGEGVSGVAPHCKIMPLRMGFFGSSSTWADFAHAIEYAWKNGADVISNSWGFGFTEADSNFAPAIKQAIINATTLGRGGLGCVVCCSAGNSAQHSAVPSLPGFVHFPANVHVPGVLTVGASDRDDRQADYSPTSGLIDIVAPSQRAVPYAIYGEKAEVWSTDIPGEHGQNSNNDEFPGEELPSSGTNYLAYTGRFGGTSAACPLVAGIAALVLSEEPGLTQLQVFDRLTTSADKVGGYTYTGQDPAHGHSSALGYGRVNAFKALHKVWVITPDGGRTVVPLGQTFTVQWGTNDPLLNKAEIRLSSDGGQTFPVALASGINNTGQFTLTSPITTIGSTYLIRVECYEFGNPSNYARDISDGDFSVWGVWENSVACNAGFSCNSPTLTLWMSWDTSVGTDGLDEVDVYKPGDIPGVDTPSTVTLLPTEITEHHAVTWHGACQTGWWLYVVKSTMAGSGVATSSLNYVYIGECLSCPPPCNPPCEFE
jgi:subtilisin family serine protease